MAEESGGEGSDTDLEELKRHHQTGSRISGAARGQRGDGAASDPEEGISPLEQWSSARSSALTPMMPRNRSPFAMPSRPR